MSWRSEPHRPEHADVENERMAALIERDDDERERVDAVLDRRYRHHPILTGEGIASEPGSGASRANGSSLLAHASSSVEPYLGVNGDAIRSPKASDPGATSGATLPVELACAESFPGAVPPVNFAALAWASRPAPSCGPIPGDPKSSAPGHDDGPRHGPSPVPRAGAVVACLEDGRPDRCRAVGRHTHDESESS